MSWEGLRVPDAHNLPAHRPISCSAVVSGATGLAQLQRMELVCVCEQARVRSTLKCGRMCAGGAPVLRAVGGVCIEAGIWRLQVLVWPFPIHAAMLWAS